MAEGQDFRLGPYGPEMRIPEPTDAEKLHDELRNIFHRLGDIQIELKAVKATIYDRPGPGWTLFFLGIIAVFLGVIAAILADIDWLERIKP
jgi:hypothetical protein